MADILKFTGSTTLPIDPDTILQEAIGKLKDVVLIGTDTDGYIYVASSTSDIGHILLLMEECKRIILDD